MSHQKLILRRFRDLWQLLADSRKGYEQAARRVRDLRLQQLLDAMASGRIAMIGDLEREIQRYDRTAMIEQGTWRGSLHRGWIGLRDALLLLNDAGVLAECARGETYIQEVYVRCSETPGMTAQQRDLLMRHHAMITVNLGEIGFLQDVRDKRMA